MSSAAIAPTTYALISAHPGRDGRVCGTWLQDCCRGLAEARERAAGTSRVNGGMPVAVVPSFVPPGSQGIGEWCESAVPLFLAGAPAQLEGPEWAASLAGVRPGDLACVLAPAASGLTRVR